MLETFAYAANSPQSPLVPFSLNRREPGPHDVLIDIKFCGVCHSDIHQVRNEWGNSSYPMVPGHEIVGIVNRTGSAVTRWKTGDRVGVGCFVDSCRTCEACTSGEEQYCEQGASFTYNCYEQDKVTPTYGGYSRHITVDENYVVRIPENLPLDQAAPLLCAGITTYSPLRHFGVKPGDRVGVIGLGGLGHLGIKLARAMATHVTVFSHSPAKQADALNLGADAFASTTDPDTFTRNRGGFDFILDTVSANHDYNAYLNLLRRDGTLVLVGLPEPTLLAAGSLIFRRRRLAGSLIGGIRETQEMLDFCAKHQIVADIERIGLADINQAYTRMLCSDVRYRFVIDLERD